MLSEPTEIWILHMNVRIFHLYITILWTDNGFVNFVQSTGAGPEETILLAGHQNVSDGFSTPQTTQDSSSSWLREEDKKKEDGK